MEEKRKQQGKGKKKSQVAGASARSSREKNNARSPGTDTTGSLVKIGRSVRKSGQRDDVRVCGWRRRKEAGSAVEAELERAITKKVVAAKNRDAGL